MDKKFFEAEINELKELVSGEAYLLVEWIESRQEQTKELANSLARL
ncbi:hypothetical protein RV14_GL001913 [Enterococcus ratti]|uniref:Uncharacterized protein n=1 Tax=Enterococcus ratti TaxID=150033 RepID=A0A1L8WQB1_9ENTE|nr:hypothetical protein RV14_GL001913 [Enterococcus ratti]